MLVKFKTKIFKFSSGGAESGWTYIRINKVHAEKLKEAKKSFRVKGFLDKFPIKQVAIRPTGEGHFMLAFNATMRKGTGKEAGDVINVRLEEDTEKLPVSQDLSMCLENEAEAYAFFKTLNPSNQNYFSQWIEAAKTIDTKTKRIVATLKALERKMNYPQMIREQTAKNRNKE